MPLSKKMYYWYPYPSSGLDPRFGGLICTGNLPSLHCLHSGPLLRKQINILKCFYSSAQAPGQTSYTRTRFALMILSLSLSAVQGILVAHFMRSAQR